MAINCLLKLSNPSTQITNIAPNITYTGDILSQFDGDFYKFEMFAFETMTFEIKVTPRDSQQIDMKLELYKEEGGTLIPLGTSFINQFNNMFIYSGEPSEYKMCLSSVGPVDYELKVKYTSFPYTIIPEMDCYHGQYIPVFDFTGATAKCDAPVFYELVAGKLPPGLTFTSNGFITGVPKELDCSTPDGHAPSFTFSEKSAQNYVSTSYNFPITIRAALVGSAATSFVDRDFSICVHNNWDDDQKAFVASIQFFETQVIIDKPQTNTNFNSTGSESAPVVAEQTFDEKVAALCKVCETEKTDSPAVLTKLEIKALCKVCAIKEKFTGLVEINTNDTCVVCKEPEEPQAISLQEIINTAFCVVCKEPEITTALREIQKTMCCETKEIEKETEKSAEPIEGIPEYCGDDLVSKMNKEKVCGGPIVCTKKDPIHGSTPKPTTITLPVNLCDSECII